MAFDYDELGTIKVNGSTITRLCEGRKEWRVTCAVCGALIAASEKGLEAYTHNDNVADVGILWGHQYTLDRKEDLGFDDIFERAFSHIDHPSICRNCIKELGKVGWGICECGCGG